MSADWRATLRGRWAALAPRERNALLAAASALALLAVWLLLVQPAWRTLREAPARLDAVDAELQLIRRLAAEAATLRAAPPVAPQQAAEALAAATTRLGGAGRLSIVGDRATLTLTALGGEALADWLADARRAARARPVAAQLTRSGSGYSGTLVVQIGAAP